MHLVLGLIRWGHSLKNDLPRQLPSKLSRKGLIPATNSQNEIASTVEPERHSSRLEHSPGNSNPDFAQSRS
jgi:hypothetical protein